jgi:hypothetical protein
VHEAACPVIALLDQTDERFVNEAAKHSQQNGRKLIDLAEAVVHSHRLLVVKASPANPPS